jgi:uncharacterized protein YecE (DUF72 family)
VARPVHVGCSGWNYRDWRGTVYPDGVPARRWLEHYATLFRTVEVNATFYRLPSAEAVENWAAQTPGDFLFSVKASRYLTHVKRLKGVREGGKRFTASIEALRDAGKLGPVLWQLPETSHRDDDRLKEALDALPGGRHCFEFRHPSWFCSEVYGLLHTFGVALVEADDPRRPLPRPPLTADFAFIRFHHGHRGRRGNYSDGELREWAERVRGLRAEAEVFAYFNNDWEAFAVRNARRLRGLVEA